MTALHDKAPPKAVRSSQWHAGEDRNGYIHRAWMRCGAPDNAFSRQQIAIANTASDLTPCNMLLTEVAEWMLRANPMMPSCC
jgi:dihydroxy-acid dehydratase